MKNVKIYMVIVTLWLSVLPSINAEELKRESYRIYEESPTEWDPSGMNVQEVGEGEIDGMPLFYRIAESGAVVTSPLWYVQEGVRTHRGGMYAEELTIPSHLPDGKGGMIQVVAVEGFRNNGLRELRIPSSVRNLGNSIEHCQLLERLEIEEGIEEICGVRYCRYLRECILPATVKSVGSRSMQFLGIREMKLPPSLVEVGDSAFAFNYQMEHLDLGNLRTAGKWAFSHSQSLKKLVLPESLESLGEGCFAFCNALEELWLPSHRVECDEMVLKYSTGLKRIIVDARTPYSIEGMSIDISDVDVYVPDGAEELYKESVYWKRAKEIHPMSELTEFKVEEP